MTVEFRTVSHRSSVLTKSLDRALETFTFGNSSCVYFVAFCEDISFDLICKFVICSVLESEFANKSLAAYASFVKVTFLCFVHTMSVSDFFFACCIFADNFFFLINKTNLHCTVTIVLYGFNLSNVAWSSL